MSRHSIRSLWRAAAWLALLALAGLPQGHLRGHEQLAAARAQASPAPLAQASPPPAEAEAHPRACPVCLSLARLKDALAPAGRAELPLLASGAVALAAAPPVPPAAPAPTHAAPRGPPRS